MSDAIELSISDARVDLGDDQPVELTIVEDIRFDLDVPDLAADVDLTEHAVTIEQRSTTVALDVLDQRVDLTTTAGAIGGNVSYVHHQDLPASTWAVIHNLGRHPSVTVVDTGGTVVHGQVTYVDAMSVSITFAGAFSGRAYLN